MAYKKSLHDRGDTIVEVLFAIVVIGIVLAGSYAVVTRSLRAEEDSQEHSYALGLIQSQIEELRAYVAANPSTVPVFNSQTGLTGCMTTSSSVTPAIISPAFNPPGSTSQSCIVQGISNMKADYTLNIAVSTNNTSGNLPIYQVSATWPSLLSGSVTDRIEIPYRVN